jgi:glutathione S-transferase
MLKILGKSSSINVRKVLWLCTEIDLPYAHEAWGQGFRSTQAPEFVALNPNATVPVIDDDGFVLWESNTICRYLASRHHRLDLLPAQAPARALVEQWMDWQSSELNGAWRYAFMGLVRQSPDHGDAGAIRASVENWTRRMAILERQLLKTGAFVVGSTFTLADIVIALSVNRWLMTPIEHPVFPAVAEYFERLGERPGFVLHCRNGTP